MPQFKAVCPPFRLFLFDNFFDEKWRDGEEIYLIGHAFGSLDGSYIWVDEDCKDAFFAQGFQRLGP
jgi:hypothetical protein